MLCAAYLGASLVAQTVQTFCLQCKRQDRPPGLGQSPEGGHGNPLQYSCLENPIDRGPWWATAQRVAKMWTRLKWLSTAIASSATANLQSGRVAWSRTQPVSFCHSLNVSLCGRAGSEPAVNTGFIYALDSPTSPLPWGSFVVGNSMSLSVYSNSPTLCSGLLQQRLGCLPVSSDLRGEHPPLPALSSAGELIPASILPSLLFSQGIMCSCL